MDPVTARMKREGNNFEILVYPREAMDFRQGKTELDNVLVSDEIFSDVEKGEKISDEILNKTFGTADKKEIAKRILKEGDIQIPKELRAELIEKKKQKIAGIISRISINPMTKAPHPLERILNAMDKKGVNINYYKSADDQVQKVIEKIKEELPISVENIKFEIKIPAQFSGAAYGKLKNTGKILKENWNNDGSLSCVLEVPAGLKNEVYDTLGSLTHGQVMIKESKNKN